MRRASPILYLAVWCVVASSCIGSPTDGGPTLRLDIVGPDTFWIEDRPVNPGCHYTWTLRATGSHGARAQLLGGRILLTLNLAPAAEPTDTVYRWNTVTIRPLFEGSAWIAAGEERVSGPYASVGTNVPSSKRRVEFDYAVQPGGKQETTHQIFYCLRP